MHILEQLIYFFAILFLINLAFSAYTALTGNVPTDIVGADGEDITLHNNRSATDPSFAQAVDFIAQDNVSGRRYSQGYQCADFAKDVHENAERAGLRCAFVLVRFNDSSDCHACNAFNTTDEGLVFFDCVEGDKIATAVKGQPYVMSSAAFGNDFTEWEPLNIISSVVPIW